MMISVVFVNLMQFKRHLPVAVYTCCFIQKLKVTAFLVRPDSEFRLNHLIVSNGSSAFSLYGYSYEEEGMELDGVSSVVSST